MQEMRNSVGKLDELVKNTCAAAVNVLARVAEDHFFWPLAPAA